MRDLYDQLYEHRRRRQEFTPEPDDLSVRDLDFSVQQLGGRQFIADPDFWQPEVEDELTTPVWATFHRRKG